MQTDAAALSPQLMLLAALGFLHIDHARSTFAPRAEAMEPDAARAVSAAMGELMRAGYSFDPRTKAAARRNRLIARAAHEVMN